MFNKTFSRLVVCLQKQRYSLQSSLSSFSLYILFQWKFSGINTSDNSIPYAHSFHITLTFEFFFFQNYIYNLYNIDKIIRTELWVIVYKTLLLVLKTTKNTVHYITLYNILPFLYACFNPILIVSLSSIFCS